MKSKNIFGLLKLVLVIPALFFLCLVIFKTNFTMGVNYWVALKGLLALWIFLNCFTVYVVKKKNPNFSLKDFFYERFSFFHLLPILPIMAIVENFSTTKGDDGILYIFPLGIVGLLFIVALEAYLWHKLKKPKSVDKPHQNLI